MIRAIIGIYLTILVLTMILCLVTRCTPCVVQQPAPTPVAIADAWPYTPQNMLELWFNGKRFHDRDRKREREKQRDKRYDDIGRPRFIYREDGLL